MFPPLPTNHYCVYTSLTLCYCRFCTRPRNTSPPQSRHIVRETSPAWRSQQRLTLVPTSPHQVYLPGGASSPALYIPHLPLPSLLESIYSLRFAPHHSFHFAHLSTTFARPCVRSFGLGTDLAAIEGLRSGITSKQLASLFSVRSKDFRLPFFLLCALSILISIIQISQVLLCPNQHRRIDLGSPHRCSPASSHAGRYTSTNVGPFLEAWSGRRSWQ